MQYIFLGIASLVLSAILTGLVRRLAFRLKILDFPGEPRKIHTKPTPLLGGFAIFFGFFIILALFAINTPYVLNGTLQPKHLIGVFLGGFILIVGGAIDDKYNIKPVWQFLFSLGAIFFIIVSGIGIREITNPFGGTINLAEWERVLFWWRGVGYRLTLPADILTAFWLLAMIYTTKFLDGLDGLVSGVTTIGTLVIFFLATATQWYQPNVGFISIILAGSFLGFLIWNWHPAKIFLGTSGSTFAGFMLGTLAIISGGKIATTLLVMGIPFFDVGWVILRRIFWERKLPTLPDRKHLHFRLLDAGFSHRGAVLLLYFISALFGMTTLVLQSKEKLIALAVLFGFMILLAVFLIVRFKTVGDTKSRAGL